MNGKKILIAEDEPHILGSLKLVFEEAGYVVIATTDGEAAFDRAKREKPDLLILDMNMGKLDGYEVWQRLQADPSRRETPAIILTAFGIERRAAKPSVRHPLTVITKPCSPYAVLERAAEILGGAPLRGTPR